MNRKRRSYIKWSFLGAIVGWAVAQTLIGYMGGSLSQWAWTPLILMMIVSVVGGAMYGGALYVMLFGGSGILTEKSDKNETGEAPHSRAA